VERSALLAPVAIGEFGLNFFLGGGWRCRFRPRAAVELLGKLSFNVEVTGAARLYRAASVWTAGLDCSQPSVQGIFDGLIIPIIFTIL
jgi:hypothetical protein